MKKFSVIFVAVAFALSLAVPAMAVHFGSLATGPTPAVDEGFSISGSYTLDAADRTSRYDTQRQWFDDDLEVVLKINKGDVTAVVDLEVSDDAEFDGTHTGDDIRGNDIIDNYYVTLDNFITDGLSLKIGEYGVSFGKKITMYSEGNHIIGLKYGLDSFDLALYIAKQNETVADPDADDDLTMFTASVKNVDFFKKLNFIFATAAIDTTTADDDYGFTGIDAAFDVGPVPLAVEYGSISDDDTAGDDGGTYYLLTVGLDEIVGFDLNVEYFKSNSDFGGNTWGDGDYYPLFVYGWDADDNGTFVDVALAIVTASYKYSDNIKLSGKVLVQGKDSTSTAGDTVGTEIDIHGTFKLASNASATLSYGTWTPGDAYAAGADSTSTAMRARLKMSF